MNRQHTAGPEAFWSLHNRNVSLAPRNARNANASIQQMSPEQGPNGGPHHLCDPLNHTPGVNSSCMHAHLEARAHQFAQRPLYHRYHCDPEHTPVSPYDHVLPHSRPHHDQYQLPIFSQFNHCQNQMSQTMKLCLMTTMTTMKTTPLITGKYIVWHLSAPTNHQPAST